MADYFKDIYWGDEQNAAEVLGYSESEWDWAIAHESRALGHGIEQLEDTSRAIIDRYQSASQRLHPDGPRNAGYFLGYRISEAYIARHGPDALVGSQGGFSESECRTAHAYDSLSSKSMRH